MGPVRSFDVRKCTLESLEAGTPFTPRPHLDALALTTQIAVPVNASLSEGQSTNA